jgi:hypothetical protein
MDLHGKEQVDNGCALPRMQLEVEHKVPTISLFLRLT